MLKSVKNARRGDRSLFLKIAAVPVSSLIILASVLFSFVPSQSGRVTLFYVPGDSAAAAFVGADRLSESIPGKSVASVKYSGAGDCAAVLMSDGSSYSLYHVGSSGVKAVNSSAATSSFVISYSGRAVACVDSSDALSVFTASNGKSTQIAESVADFALSPDGETVLYSAENDSACELYLYSGRKTELIGSGYTPVGVSDGAEHIYVLSPDGALCMLNSDGSLFARLISGADSDFICFNEDLSQSLFSDGEYTYLSVEGASRLRLVPGEAEPASAEGFSYASAGGAKIFGCSNMTDMYYADGSLSEGFALFYISSDARRSFIAENAVEYRICRGEAIYLSSSGGIYRADADGSELIAGSAQALACLGSGRRLFRLSDSELYLQNGSEAELVASGVASLCELDDSLLCFILSDGRLYSTSGSGSRELQSGVHSVRASGDALFICKNYNAQSGMFDLYTSDGRSEPRQILSGASFVS